MKKFQILLVVLLFAACVKVNYLPTRAFSAINTFYDFQDNSVLITCRTKTPEIIKKIDPDAPDYQPGGGSGSIIFHEANKSWKILTAAHVIEKCHDERKITILLDGTEYSLPYKLRSINTKSDLALLETRASFSVPRGYLRIAKQGPQLGDELYMGGYPGVVGDGFILTKGMVAHDNAINRGTRYLLIDGQITFGNSGGATLNKNMKIVGINSQIIVDVFSAYSLGAAIHTDEIWKFLKKTDNELYRKLQKD